MPTSTHLRHIVDRHANDPSAAHRVAFSMGSEQRTFADVSRNADRVARALEGLGVVRGDRVAVFMGNRVEWVDILFGATTMGAICVPVNVLLTGSDVNAVFADATPKVVVVDALAESPLLALETLPELVVTVGEVSLPAGVTSVPFADLLTGSDDPGHWDVGGDDPAMMYYTSGTTGRPKAAMHSHAGILWNTL
ncbi:MAG: long-chain fatty acid--CoA ligase, partial [Actinomycetales bacterium]